MKRAINIFSEREWNYDAKINIKEGTINNNDNKKEKEHSNNDKADNIDMTNIRETI